MQLYTIALYLHALIDHCTSSSNVIAVVAFEKYIQPAFTMKEIVMAI